mmetsp:Transcript_11828/g.40761  ORF Transcript_11828/g.40761 Transcript_11828/m.40761 type:complete len:283 (-) Transcript_11828:1109-1957(-)
MLTLHRDCVTAKELFPPSRKGGAWRAHSERCWRHPCSRLAASTCQVVSHRLHLPDLSHTLGKSSCCKTVFARASPCARADSLCSLDNILIMLRPVGEETSSRKEDPILYRCCSLSVSPGNDRRDKLKSDVTKPAAKIIHKGPESFGSMMLLNLSQTFRNRELPLRSVRVTNPSPHISLLIMRLPVMILVLTTGSTVSIFVVARVRAGRSPSQYSSPTFKMFAIFTSPCATPQACIHRSDFPISSKTLIAILRGAPARHLLLAVEPRSPSASSKTEHRRRTLR